MVILEKKIKDGCCYDLLDLKLVHQVLSLLLNTHLGRYIYLTYKINEIYQR